jgi:hypothetical protein
MSILDISMMTGFVPDTSDLELVPRPGELRLGGGAKISKRLMGERGPGGIFTHPPASPAEHWRGQVHLQV